MRSLLASLLLLISGCSMFTPPSERPVIEDKLNRGFFDDSDAVGTLSLTPERRIVLVNFKNNRFCAEAPTEVGQDISKLIKATADAESKTGQRIGLGAVAAGNYSNSVLNRRTQGVQLFLANSYFMCQMYMNEAIDKKELLKTQIQLLNAVAPLIEKELPLMYQQQQKGLASSFRPLDFAKILSADNDIAKNQSAEESNNKKPEKRKELRKINNKKHDEQD